MNPKMITEKGKSKLHKSLNKFGLAGTIVVNQDLQIIDGHSRKRDLMESGVTEVWVSMPSRPLTESEYKEFNAFFDIARAGEPDKILIENLFSDETIEEWDFKGEKPMPKPKEMYPIIPKFDEKLEAIIIVIDTVQELTYIQNALKLQTERSYKNKATGTTFICTGKKFIESWQSK